MSRSRRQPPGGVPGVSVPETAPGALELFQAFVNTVSVDGRPDLLATPAALSRWLSRRGLLDAGIELSEQELARVLDVRAAVRQLFAAKTRGEHDGEASDRLEQAAGPACSRPRYDDGGPVALGPGDSDLDGALGAILAAFVVGRATVYWPHFRLCARQSCRRAFYDGSRSRTGKWCTKRCGARVRMAAHRRSRKRR